MTDSASVRRTRRATVASLAALLLPLLFATPLQAQTGVVRGVVTDTAGRPLRGVEVFAIRTDRNTRTDARGRYVLTRIPWGQSVVMARTPGYAPAERAVVVDDAGSAVLDLRLKLLVQLIDTLRIVSHDGCAPYQYEGFECRRAAGIGQFRGPEELRALRPVFWADMFDGLTGFRRVPFTNAERNLDYTVISTTGWRCLNVGYNGREPTALESVIRPADIYAIEHYEVYEKVPEAYKRLSWNSDRPEACALVMLWTREFMERNRRP